MSLLRGDDGQTDGVGLGHEFDIRFVYERSGVEGLVSLPLASLSMGKLVQFLIDKRQ